MRGRMVLRTVPVILPFIALILFIPQTLGNPTMRRTGSTRIRGHGGDRMKVGVMPRMLRLQGGGIPDADSSAVAPQASSSTTAASLAPAAQASDSGAAALQGLLNLLGGMTPATGTAASKKEQPLPLASDDTPNFGLGMTRSMRAMAVYNEIKAEYDALEKRNCTSAKERETLLHELHAKSAEKCLALARANGGIYNKAAQFAASLQGGAGERGIPEEYIQALKVCTDHAPGQSFCKMDTVLIEEFGMSGRQLFKHIDEEPIAAASLGQVHRAILKDGSEVAVKIIYPDLRRELASDFAVFKTLGAQMKPGGFDLQWVVKDFEDALKKELDLESEARNSEECAQMLAHIPNVRVPKVFWNYTRHSVLTSEFVPGMVRVDDKEGIERAGMSRREIGSLIADVFNEMALCHGLVHGDPHMGNVYVRPYESHQGSLGGSSKAPELVILDHGLYHTVESGLRTDLCNLMLACVERRKQTIIEISSKLAGPLSRFLPLLLSPSFVFGGKLSHSDLISAFKGQIPKDVSLRDIGSTIEAIHENGGNILGVLHSFGYTRGLLNALDFSERLRLRSVATFAVMGLMGDEKRIIAVQDRIRGMLSVEWTHAISMIKLQVDITMLMVPGLIIWRFLRPILVGLQGFAALAVVNVAVAWFLNRHDQ